MKIDATVFFTGAFLSKLQKNVFIVCFMKFHLKGNHCYDFYQGPGMTCSNNKEHPVRQLVFSHLETHHYNSKHIYNVSTLLQINRNKILKGVN